MKMLLCTLALAVVATGCIREDLPECSDSYTLTAMAFDDSGVELGQGDVREVMLYVFDDELRLVRSLSVQVDQKVAIEIPRGSNLHIIAWGNTAAGLQHVTALEEGIHKDDGLISLLPAGVVGSNASPDDLFYGEVSVTDTGSGGEAIIPLHRAVGSMAVTVRGLKEFTGFADDNYSILVRGTPASLDFYGNPADGSAVYRPAGSFVPNGSVQEYLSPAFNVIPAAAVVIDIYHGTALVASVSQDASGNPVAVQKGQLTNVLINLRTALDVSVALTPWGQYQVWKEF
jgi:hypothetical protein